MVQLPEGLFLLIALNGDPGEVHVSKVVGWGQLCGLSKAAIGIVEHALQKISLAEEIQQRRIGALDRAFVK